MQIGAAGEFGDLGSAADGFSEDLRSAAGEFWDLRNRNALETCCQIIRKDQK